MDALRSNNYFKAEKASKTFFFCAFHLINEFSRKETIWYSYKRDGVGIFLLGIQTSQVTIRINWHLPLKQKIIALTLTQFLSLILRLHRLAGKLCIFVENISLLYFYPKRRGEKFKHMLSNLPKVSSSNE